MRRDELEALGIQLPVLATVALGALPGAPRWAGRLLSAGVDVVASGAARDTAETWAAARAQVPFRPVKAMPGDLAALVAAGARIVEWPGEVPAGVYRLGPGEDVVIAVDGGSADVEDVDVVGRRIVEHARDGSPARLWVVSTPGLDSLPEDVAEAKLRVLGEAAYRARLVFAKEQFTDDD